jgi:hypothetical protein
LIILAEGTHRQFQARLTEDLMEGLTMRKPSGWLLAPEFCYPRLFLTGQKHPNEPR